MSMAEGPGHGTINGVPFASESISVKQSGQAITKQTDFGTTFVPLPGVTTVSVSSPYAGNGTPIDVAKVTLQQLAKEPFLMVVFFDSGASFTMWAMVSDKSITSNQTAGADASYEFVCATPIEA